MLKVTARMIKAELERRGVKVEVIVESPSSLMRYFYNGEWHLLHSTLTQASAGAGGYVCDQKDMANSVARLNNVPVPETVAFENYDQANAFMQRLGNIVVKPADSAHGLGVTVQVNSEDQLHKAVELAKEDALNGIVLLQQMITGGDLRMLVIGGKHVATARRIPAEVVGDGAQTLRQLIEYENSNNPERGANYEKRLVFIDMDAAERFLGQRLDTEIPAKGQVITVVGTANIGTGGRAVDYTDKVTPELITAAEKFATATGVAVCGVDFIWDEETGKFYFIEGNSVPSFCLHTEPSEGQPRVVDKIFVDFILAQSNFGWNEAK